MSADDPADQRTPLEKLEQAISDFANEISDEAPILLQSAVVVFETVRYMGDDAGNLGHHVRYASAGPSTSMASVVGLLTLGREQVVDDILDDGDDS